jgi:hypothetical protein
MMMPRDILSAMAAAERVELYYAAHPASPSAIHRPRLSIRCGVWVAVLGESVRKGVAGFGATVEAALSAFDAQYFNTLRQTHPNPAVITSRTGRPSVKRPRHRASRL